MSIRKWIADSTLIALFSESFMINVGSVHLLYFSFLLFLNLSLLAGEESLWLLLGLRLFFAYVLLSGLFGIVRGIDPWAAFGKASSGVVPTALSFSSAGLLDLLLCLYLAGTQCRFGKFIGPTVVLLAGLAIYNSSSLFRLRMNDTVQSIASDDVTAVNQSTFGLVSNGSITQQVLVTHPILGGGLDSHRVAFEQYIGQVEGAAPFAAVGAGRLGRRGAIKDLRANHAYRATMRLEQGLASPLIAMTGIALDS